MKLRRVYLGGSIAVLLAAGLALNCGSSGHAAGSVGGACLASGACNSGLVCLSQICVQPTDAGAGGGAGTGGAGRGIGVACTAANTMVAPSNGLIADFSGPDAGSEIDGVQQLPSSVLEIGGAVFAYPGGSAAAPAYSFDGALHLTENGPATSATQYAGLFLGFTDCIDATAFTGVSFTISGSFAGCTMQYATGDVEHSDSTVNTYLGTGVAGSYQPQVALTASEITAAPQILMMPFVGNAALGSPATPLDKTKLISVFWQFVIPAAGPSTSDAAPAACVGDITIDNVSFY